jgi:magnesium-transporting ATPase (P-type)
VFHRFVIKKGATKNANMTSDALPPPDRLKELLHQLRVLSLDHGLTSDEVSSRREDAGHFNTVAPPIQCPAWICCLLPCIRHIPSMKAYQQIQPEDAEVKREGRWIRYDASALVQGDIIRIAKGDIIPADCIALQLDDDELLVDHRLVSGNDKPVSIRKVDTGNAFNVSEVLTLYWGGRVVQGSGVAVCVAVGPNTQVAQLIQTKRFPVTPRTALDDGAPMQEDVLERSDENSVGIALLRQSSRDSISHVV